MHVIILTDKHHQKGGGGSFKAIFKAVYDRLENDFVCSYVFWSDRMTTYVLTSLLPTSLLLEWTQSSAICWSSFWVNITALNSVTFVSPARLLCLLSSFFIPRRALQHPKSTIHKSCSDDAFPVTYWSGTPQARQFVLHSASLPCDAVAQNAEGGQGVIIYRRSSRTNFHSAVDLQYVALIDPTEKPSKVFIECPRLLLTKAKNARSCPKKKEKKSSSSFICSWAETLRQ